MPFHRLAGHLQSSQRLELFAATLELDRFGRLLSRGVSVSVTVFLFTLRVRRRMSAKLVNCWSRWPRSVSSSDRETGGRLKLFTAGTGLA